MKYQAATLLLLPYSCTQAFTTTKTIITSPFIKLKSPATSIHSKSLPTLFVNQKSSFLFASDSDSDKQDDEIERLKSLAAKLRAEAAQLEVCLTLYFFYICVCALITITYLLFFVFSS